MTTFTPPEGTLLPDLLTEPPLTDLDLQRLYDEVDAQAADEGSDWQAVLHDALSGSGPDLPAAGWRITDESGAQWAGSTMALADAELAHLRELATEWLQRIQAWEVEQGRKAARTRTHMELLLTDYGLRVREAGGPATITLPSVVIKTTDAKPKATVADDEAVAAYIEAMLSAPDPGAELPDLLVEVRKAWLQALDDSGLTPADLVRRSAKVYLDPLRSLTTLGVVSDGWRFTATLACGHTIDRPCSGLDDVDVLQVAEVVACPACSPDPIEGDQAHPVAEVVVYEQTRPAVFGPGGVELPGTAVDPGGITARAKARA